MKTAWIRLCLTAAFLVTALAPMTAPRATAGEIQVAKVAVVRLEQAFYEYNFVKESQVAIEAKYKPIRERIDNMMTSFQREQQRFVNDPLMRPNTPDYNKREMELRLTLMNIEAEQRKYLADHNKDNAEVFIRFYEAYRNACIQAARYFNIDILLTATDPNLPPEAKQENVPVTALRQEIMSRLIPYSSQNIDITAAVITILNNAYQNKSNPFPPRPEGVDDRWSQLAALRAAFAANIAPRTTPGAGQPGGSGNMPMGGGF